MCSRLNYFALKEKYKNIILKLFHTCIRPRAWIHQTRIVSANVRHLEGAHPEQTVDGIEVQTG